MAINYYLLGKRIKFFRNKAGYSQSELGKQIFANNIHISNIETGRKAPSLDLLVSIANTLSVSADDLLIDSLDHSVSTADSELHLLLLDCNETEVKIIIRILKDLKSILYQLGI